MNNPMKDPRVRVRRKLIGWGKKFEEHILVANDSGSADEKKIYEGSENEK